MRPIHRRLVVGGCAAGAVAVIAFLARPKPLAVDLGRVERGDMRVTVDADGRTRVRHRYVVAAPVAGHLQRVVLVEGDRVAAGTVLARLAPLPLDSTTAAQVRARVTAADALVREADARVAQARVSSADAERDAARARTLEAAGAIAPRDRERSELALRIAREEFDAAESRARATNADARIARAALGALEANASDIVLVRAPVAGQVLRIIEPNARVVGAGMPLIEIGDPRDIEVVVDVLSADAVKIEPGATAWLEDWGGDGAIEACVRRIEPSAITRVSALGVDEQRVDVVLDLPDVPASLGDGFRVDARIVVWEGRRVLTVPSSAVFRSGDAWQLYAVRDGRARRVTVAVGHRSPAAIEITGGIDDGTPVILFPSDRIAEGVRVRAR